MSSVQRQASYLALAAIALVGCWYFNIQWLNADFDHSLKGFVEASFANSASSSISWDIVLIAASCAVFVFVEGGRLAMPMWWRVVCVIAFVVIAVSVFFPIFLATRERAMEKRRA
jgi:hypothetical protein